MGRAGLVRGFDEPGLFFRAERLSDPRSRLKFQQVLLPKPDAQYIAGHIHQAEEKTNLFVDGFGRRVLTQAGS